MVLMMSYVLYICMLYDIELLVLKTQKKSENSVRRDREKCFKTHLVVQQFRQHAPNLAPVHIRSCFVTFSSDRPDLVTLLWMHLIPHYLIKHCWCHSNRLGSALMVICWRCSENGEKKKPKQNVSRIQWHTLHKVASDDWSEMESFRWFWHRSWFD